MKKTLLIILITAILTALITLIIFEIIAQNDQLIADEIEVIDSEILKESRKLLVHLPKSYSSHPEKKYPIMIALDGTSHDLTIARAANTLSYADVIGEFITIGIPNENRNRDLTPQYLMQGDDPTDLGKGDQFLAFIEKEVLPLIQKKYRCNNYQMISGHSRAGMYCIYALLEKPDLFNAYFCYSPAFWRNDNLIVEKAKVFFQENSTSDHFIYMSLGTEENQKMKKAFDLMTDAFPQRDTLGFRLFSTYTDQANHQTNPYYSIPSALKIWSEGYYPR